MDSIHALFFICFSVKVGGRQIVGRLFDKIPTNCHANIVGKKVTIIFPL